MATITVERGAQQDVGKTFSLAERSTIIGRSNSVPAPDVGLSDRYVSRRHIEILFEGGRYGVRDLGSTNGTSLDGGKLETDRTYPMLHDALIGLGIGSGAPRILLRFRETPTESTTRIDVPDTGVFSWLSMDNDAREVRVDGHLVVLARKEFDLIRYMFARAGKICSRDELVANVWPKDDPGGVADAAIDQLIHRLRLKIEPDPARPRRIKNRKGFGYVLVLT